MSARVEKSPAPRSGRPAWLDFLLPVLLALAAGIETLRVGFFADDFHFLDVARRIPLAATLGGQFGVYPWYRPLSRELYFAVVASAGAWALPVARLLSIAAVAGCVVLIERLGRSLIDPRGARVAAALFATYSLTRFLMAWASGFQDLLAMLLTLLALEGLRAGRSKTALLFAALAPFAKETAIVVFPLMAAWDGLARGRSMRRAVPMVAVMAGVVALHLMVQAGWHTGGTAAHVEFDPGALQNALFLVAGGFVGGAPVATLPAIALAALAAIAAGAWLWNAPAPARTPVAMRGRTRAPGPAVRGVSRGETVAARQGDVDARWTPLRALLFLAGAAVLGIAPLVVGQWLRFTSPHAYYAFAAAPWLALLAGMALAALPGRAGLVLAVAVVGWNALALGYRGPDLDDPASWIFHRWDWPEAERLSEVADRLSSDLRRELRDYPDSLVVLYRALPEGTFFQTEDGPSARLALGDPRVRAYFINSAPYPLRSGRYEVMNFDQDSLHLVRSGIPPADRGPYGGSALASGEVGVAWAFAAYGDSAELSAFDGKYIRAASALVAEGVAGYVRELHASGLDDSSLATARRLSAEVLGGAPAVAPGLAAVLQHPCDAAAHVALADRFEEQRALVSAAMELRIAAALDPRRVDERLRLVDLLRRMKRYDAAERDAVRLVADLRGTAREADAQRALDEVRRLRAAPPEP